MVAEDDRGEYVIVVGFGVAGVYLNGRGEEV